MKIFAIVIWIAAVLAACAVDEVSTSSSRLCTWACEPSTGECGYVGENCGASGGGGGGSIGGGTGGGGPADPGSGGQTCVFLDGYNACVVPDGMTPITWGTREQWWCCSWTGCHTEWGVCIANDWD